jgi:hypothetical protein
MKVLQRLKKRFFQNEPAVGMGRLAAFTLRKRFEQTASPS